MRGAAPEQYSQNDAGASRTLHLDVHTAMASQRKDRPFCNVWANVMSDVNVKAWLGFISLAIVMGLLLFVTAGTTHYWQGWVYLAVFFGASLLTSLYLVKRDPAPLKRRLKGGPMAEKEKTQKIIMLFTSLGLIALLVVPALDHRFEWSAVPPYAVIVGDILVALGFYIIFLVYRENTFTSATIEVAEGQKVISTGQYACVRHPMYAGPLLYLLGTPLALASYWGGHDAISYMAAL
jgi:protein-S-isoprenylcysteine O-methyltransferase Ste14